MTKIAGVYRIAGKTLNLVAIQKLLSVTLVGKFKSRHFDLHLIRPLATRSRHWGLKNKGRESALSRHWGIE